MVKYYQIMNGIARVSNDQQSPVIVFVEPSDDELETLKQLGISEHDITSSFDIEEIARIEIYDDGGVFIVWKIPKNYSYGGQLVFNVSSVGIFFDNNKIVFILPDEMGIFESKYFRNINSIQDILLAFLQTTINHFYGHLRGIKIVSSEIETKINTSLDNKYLLQMFSLSESLVYYLNALNSNLGVLIKIKEYRDKIGFSKQSFEKLKDLIIDNRQCYKQARILSMVLAEVMDARASIVNNNMNILIKNLTIINVVMLPLNLIASIGGMSEYTMMTESLGISWPIAYLSFLVFTFILGIGIVFILNAYINRFMYRRSKR
ncbi:MAG: magnesium transporter CorA family protein [Spirochaetia bacterium]|nr:magnesium transporter CorA family protein [Spirochaetota bacterium]MCX8097324.1 magnesium transporter CorA family protein [Spirochaetota bacterium]MDW8112827.1 magnesium transporter CorA family protein [Spirochaetia bacterium]